mgnify:CR=1 FL=1
MEKLTRNFYLRNACTVAYELIGKILVHRQNENITSGIIIEAEAYRGPEDKAAHSYNNRRTARTEIMFHDGGFAYVYMIYGMHCCFNITANIYGKPEAVLIRALEPLEGIDIMKARRKTDSVKNLCNGPGKLCSAMGITRELYGEDLCSENLYVTDNKKPAPIVSTSPRINIDYAEEYINVPWRYYAEGSRYISR